MRIFLYLISIVIANVATAALMPLEFGIFIIPVGTLFAGATFIFRDLVQNKYGRKKTYMFIVIALVLSATVSFILGDTLAIVAASALAFIIAESADTEIYSRLKVSFVWRVFYSGIVGGILDSAVFVIVGMSPIGAGFIPWEAVPVAILSQVIAKSAVQTVGALILGQMRGFRAVPVQS
ncbi:MULTISPECIES: VUT family protein [Bhargavaea]|uniref:VUT family protein n=1 Tax=Bhargavaea changchunensis TaxID=2134037 RepID=A0ABW2NJP7_9BACL|nr:MULTISPECIES: VUT family protein [Bhargavaea]MCM3086727.1 VUT family protein [Bhargavaea ginsengi]